MLEQEQTPRFSKDAMPIDDMSNQGLWYESNTDNFLLMYQQLKPKLGKLSVRVSARTDKNQ